MKNILWDHQDQGEWKRQEKFLRGGNTHPDTEITYRRRARQRDQTRRTAGAKA